MSKQVLRWMAGLIAATLLIAPSGCGDDEPEAQAAKDGGAQRAGRGRDGGQPSGPDGGSSGEPRPDRDSGARPDRDAGPARAFAPEELWGPPGTPLPPGAELVSADELSALKAQDGFTTVTRATLDDAIAADEQATADARAYVAATIAGDPALTEVQVAEPTPSDTLVAQRDGNYRLVLADGSSVVLHGKDWIDRALASSLQRTPARDNREAQYRALLAALPDDQREDLPAPDALGSVSDEQLAGYQREVVQRAEQWLSNAASLGGNAPDSGCTHRSENLYVNASWKLKPFTTAIRDQGERGTCVAFAITAGIEADVYRTFGIGTDYSEQELYSVAKGIWAPSADAYGDGLHTSSALDRLQEGYLIDAERRWRYNPSLMRFDDEANARYENSCEDYSSPYCSDTNHQMKVSCALIDDEHVCGVSRPPAVETGGGGYDPVRLEGHVSLWNLLEPENSLAAVRAHLSAGHPVVVSTYLDGDFELAAQRAASESPPPGVLPGWDTQNLLHGGVGGHTLLAVGYVTNGQITGSELPEASGGGYLILKNSWGCHGDGGYMHVGYDWARLRILQAHAIVAVNTNAEWPVVQLSTPRSTLPRPGPARLRIGVRRAALVELYRGTERIYDLRPDDPGAQVLTVDDELGEADAGFHTYWARVVDQFGNESVSGNVVVWANFDVEAPRVTVTADKTSLIAPGSLTLRAVASDNVGVTVVKFWRGANVIAQDTTPPYSATFLVGAGSAGRWYYSAQALDAAGHHETSNPVVVDVTAPPTSLLQAPKILAFQASPAQLPAGGGEVLLHWDVSGAPNAMITPTAGTVTPRGTRKVAVSETTTFELTASNSAGTRSASFTVPVERTVDPPEITPTAYVGPAGDDTANDCSQQSTPCRTLLHAATQAGADGKVLLLDGVYDAQNQGATFVALPAGTRLHATGSEAVLRVRLDLIGGEVRGLIVDRTDNSTSALRLVGGTVTLEALRFRGVFPASQVPALMVGAGTVATLTPGSVENYAADVVAATTNAQSLIALSSSGRLTIDGGVLDSPGAGPALSTDVVAAAIAVENTSHLTLNNVTLRPSTRGIRITGAGTVELDGCTVEARAIVGNLAAAIDVDGPDGAASHITVVNSTLRGFVHSPTGGGNNSGIFVLGGSPQIDLQNVTIAQNAVAFYSAPGTSVAVVAMDVTIENQEFGGWITEGEGTFRLIGGVVRNNELATVSNIVAFRGALNFLSASAHYDVYLRNVDILDNRASFASTSTNLPANCGFNANGDATSVYDLGTAASPGGNTLRGNQSPIQTQPGTSTYTSNLAVGAGVTVTAVGTSFEPNLQGADANGSYAVDTAPCGPSPCELTSGQGTNFRIAVGGKLRLAE